MIIIINTQYILNTFPFNQYKSFITLIQLLSLLLTTLHQQLPILQYIFFLTNLLLTFLLLQTLNNHIATNPFLLKSVDKLLSNIGCFSSIINLNILNTIVSYNIHKLHFIVLDVIFLLIHKIAINIELLIVRFLLMTIFNIHFLNFKHQIFNLAAQNHIIFLLRLLYSFIDLVLLLDLFKSSLLVLVQIFE